MNKKNILHVCTFHCSRRVIRRLIIRSRPFVDCRVYRQRQRALAFLANEHPNRRMDAALAGVQSLLCVCVCSRQVKDPTLFPSI